jgi:multiple antibiotic resistance protein
VLTAFALGGQYLLTVIGISLPALRIAGGILLLLLAVEMVFARHSGLRSTTEVEAREARVREDVAVFPLAVPLLAGPAAITSAILLMEDVRGDLILQGAVICGMLLVLGITYIMFLFASAVMTRIGVTGVNVIGRAFGIILAALAVQYIIDGARAAFPALTG